MKTLLCTLAMIILFAAFMTYQADTDSFLLQQEELKHAADNCSAAASLYYTADAYGEGIKIFNKEEGNKAIAHLIQNGLREAPQNYYAYYFDGDGTMYTYEGESLMGKQTVEYPYLFQEPLTGYRQMIREPMVVVTIDYLTYDYRLPFLHDMELIRTSGYEYVGELERGFIYG